MAAQAAEAARAQGRFWDYFDLMTHEKRLTRDDLIEYAEQLELDVERFRRELDNQTHLPRVNRDHELATALDIYQTPTFIINGRKLVGERPIDKFRQVIDEALAETVGGR